MRLIMTSQVYQRAPTGKNLDAASRIAILHRAGTSPPDGRADRRFAVRGGRPETGRRRTDIRSGRSTSGLESTDARRTRSARGCWRAWPTNATGRAWPAACRVRSRSHGSVWLEPVRGRIPAPDRETAPNVLQPGVLANSTASDLADARVKRKSRPGRLGDQCGIARANWSTRIFLRYPRPLADVSRTGVRFEPPWPLDFDERLFIRPKSKSVHRRQPPLPQSHLVESPQPGSHDDRHELERRARPVHHPIRACGRMA